MKLLSCTFDLIDAPSESRGFEAQRFSDQLLKEMRSHGIDPTREKVREYINAGVQLLNETIENKNFFNPDLQRECETALASTIGKFELFFFETANNGNLTTESLIEEIDVLKSLFPNANENSLRSNLLPSSLYSPEVYCKLDRISKFLAA
ncbi:MAG: hypothetical protein JSR39_03300, partial [Verrucomicrobia bacterium]|nr:hypothetical protein [Verrucomicrobiota bacterium]